MSEPEDGNSDLESDDVAAILPLRFKLLLSRRSSKLLIPCLTTTLNGIEVVRILDPELGEGFVSAARLFVAAGIAILDGLVHFDLRKPEYDTGLANLATFDDIWIPFSTASRIARELGLSTKLAALLDPSSKLAWSLDDGDPGGILHNWKIPAEVLSPGSYSTDAMLSTPFGSVEVLRDGVQIRTLLDRDALQANSAYSAQSEYEKLLPTLVTWLSLIYEERLDEEQEPLRTETNEHETPKSTFDDSIGRTSTARSLISIDKLDLDFVDNLLVGLNAANKSFGEQPAPASTARYPGTPLSLAEGKTLIYYDHTKPESTAARLVRVDGYARLLAYCWRTSLSAQRQDTKREDTGRQLTTLPNSLQTTRQLDTTMDDNDTDRIGGTSDLEKAIIRIQKVSRSMEEALQRQGVYEASMKSDRSLSQLEHLASLNFATIVIFSILSYTIIRRVIELASGALPFIEDIPSFQRLVSNVW